MLMLDHGMNLNSAFLHCSKMLVGHGEKVKRGQVIGHIGATGRATVPSGEVPPFIYFQF